MFLTIIFDSIIPCRCVCVYTHVLMYIVFDTKRKSSKLTLELDLNNLILLVVMITVCYIYGFLYYVCFASIIDIINTFPFHDFRVVDI